jgi:hypothetical protein
MLVPLFSTKPEAPDAAAEIWYPGAARQMLFATPHRFEKLVSL